MYWVNFDAKPAHSAIMLSSHSSIAAVSSVRASHSVISPAVLASTSRAGRHVCSRDCSCRAGFQGIATAPEAKKSTKNGEPAHWSGGWAAVTKGQPLEPWGHALGELGPDEIDITVTHNGVCHSDIHMKDNDWGISTFPFIPGHEVVGVVSAKGAQVRGGLEIGQRVGVGWMVNSCRRCPSCLRGDENVCDTGYTGTIVGNNGGFQAVLRLTSDFAFAIPDGLDSPSAAPLLCAGITVFAPLKRHLKPGMKVAIMGIGGLGHLAVQFANVMGGVVTAIDMFKDKETEARKLGATNFVAWTPEAPAAHQGDFDLIINCASGAVKMQDLMTMLRNDGTVVQIGIPGGNPMLEVPLQGLVFGQKRVVGSIVGGRSDTDAMLKMAAEKGVRPLIEIMPVAQVNEAITRVQSGKARYRVVLDMANGAPVCTTVAPTKA